MVLFSSIKMINLPCITFLIYLFLILSFIETPIYARTHYDQKTIAKIQYALKQKGYDPGTIDGKWGRKSKTALIKFLKNNNIKSNGEIDNRVIDLLQIKSLDNFNFKAKENIRKLDIKKLKIGMTIKQFKRKFPKIKVQKLLYQGKINNYNAKFDNFNIYFTRPALGYKIYYIYNKKKFKPPCSFEEINIVIDNLIKRYGEPTKSNSFDEKYYACYGDCEDTRRIKYGVKDEGEALLVEVSRFKMELVLESDKLRKMNEASWSKDVKKLKENKRKKEIDDLF